MDTNEYERLTTLFLDCIYRVAINSCKNYTDAEDVVQNVFLKLWERKHYFADDEQAKFWLIRVTINECTSLWRSPWKRRTISLEEFALEPKFSMPEKSNLYYAVRKLPIKYRQVIYLYYYEDYNVREIAEILRLSETAIRSRLARARKQLKESLKEV